MKKKKLLISPELIRSDAHINAEVERRMAMDESERYRDPKCEKLPPCVLCHEGGDIIRKAFVPIDCALTMKQSGLGNHTSMAICLCAKCIVNLLRDTNTGKSELIYQVLNNNDLKSLII